MPRPLMMSIAAVERDTGLSKDTLRVWEKRYGFPNPVRDAQGERCYPLDQLERLRLIKRLLDVGHRPGRVVALPVADLQTLAEHSADALVPPAHAASQATPRSPATPVPHGASGPDRAARTAEATWVTDALARVDAHDVAGLKRILAKASVHLGLAHFTSDVVAPLLQAMGEGWLRGRFQVPQEHWVSHCLQQSLHSAIHALPPALPEHAPRVLLSTFPGEPHAMGLLMVEAWLSLLEAQPINLGPQTPLWDLVHAAANHHADVVALSFSASAPASLVQDTLLEFRAKLPPRTALWVGGRHPLLLRRPPPGVLAMDDLDTLRAAVNTWRTHHPRQPVATAP
jgi:MerR family transcriptional regulator, light-induced transcriptional regulator